MSIEEIIGNLTRAEEGVPDDVRRDCMDCATQNGRISYHWLLALWKRGRAHAEGVLTMTVARLGGIVEGRPTERVNFLQRIDELRQIEAQRADQEAEIARLRTENDRLVDTVLNGLSDEDASGIIEKVAERLLGPTKAMVEKLRTECAGERSARTQLEGRIRDLLAVWLKRSIGDRKNYTEMTKGPDTEFLRGELYGQIDICEWQMRELAALLAVSSPQLQEKKEDDSRVDGERLSGGQDLPRPAEGR